MSVVSELKEIERIVNLKEFPGNLKDFNGHKIYPVENPEQGLVTIFNTTASPFPEEVVKRCFDSISKAKAMAGDKESLDLLQKLLHYQEIREGISFKNWLLSYLKTISFMAKIGNTIQKEALWKFVSQVDEVKSALVFYQTIKADEFLKDLQEIKRTS